MPVNTLASDVAVSGAFEAKSTAQFDSTVDLTKHQLLNAQIQNLATAPSSPVLGQIYFDTVKNKLGSWNGTSWDYYGVGDMLKSVYDANADGIVDNADKLDNQDGTYYLNRTNHTGTQLAATISDFNNAVRTNSLDQMAVPGADLNINSKKITNVANPISGTDACNLQTAQSLIQGIGSKTSVKAATTANISLTGTQTVDGIALIVGDRCLVKNQTTASANGIYVVASAAWSRATDADTWAELVAQFCFVEQGTVNGDNGWLCTVNAGGTLGTTAVTYVQFSGAGQIVDGNALSKNGNQLDVNVDGQSIEISSDALQIKLDPAGALGKSATGAKVSVDGSKIVIVGNQLTLGAGYGVKKFTGTITGNSAATSFTITHNLNTRDVVARIYDSTTFVEVIPIYEHTDSNNLKIYFSPAPATGTNYNVVILG